jgi:hypothetical protein
MSGHFSRTTRITWQGKSYVVPEYGLASMFGRAAERLQGEGKPLKQALREGMAEAIEHYGFQAWAAEQTGHEPLKEQQ